MEIEKRRQLIEQNIREHIRSLAGYSCAREEFSGKDVVLLDANENPYDTGYNRYPDPWQQALKETLAELKGVRKEQLVLGNGSDELIELLIRATCEPNRDNIIVFSPGYAMYEISARINGVEVRKLTLDRDFMPEWERLFEAVDASTRLIFFCTPNNPTGNSLPLERVLDVAGLFGGLVVVDEAYIDFSGRVSAATCLEDYPNVVVLQTLSKAWGLAGLRVGIGVADPLLVGYLNRVKPPYNIGSLTQQKALEASREQERFHFQVDKIKQERERLYRAFTGMTFLERVYPSESNFILVCLPAYQALYQYLIANGIVVRVRHIPPRVVGGLRISVGTPEENDWLIRCMMSFGIEITD